MLTKLAETAQKRQFRKTLPLKYSGPVYLFIDTTLNFLQSIHLSAKID